MAHRQTRPQPELVEHLRQVPFVKRLKYTSPNRAPDPGYDGKLEIQTPTGTFHFLVQIKKSHLSRSSASQLLTWRPPHAGKTPVFLFAPYIARPMAERLMSGRIAFVDLAGNIHLRLGDKYNWTVLGREQQVVSQRRTTTAAQIQLLFQYATDPASIQWPVRRLEAAAGISKSKAAQARKQLIEEGLLIREREIYELAPFNVLSDRLITGYSQLLRPKLIFNRFRFPEKTADAFLDRLQAEKESLPGRYSLTGGPAADRLQHFYRGPEVPLFVNPFSRSVAQRLRLLPDREGPVIAMRAFGDVVFWRDIAGHTIAPPWLIYAELLSSSEPRAHEAAEELRRGLLS